MKTTIKKELKKYTLEKLIAILWVNIGHAPKILKRESYSYLTVVI